MSRRRTPTVGKKQKILSKTGGKCAYCLIPLTIKTMTIEHIVPVARYGSNKLPNLLPACAPCNKARGKRQICGERKGLPLVPVEKILKTLGFGAEIGEAQLK